MCHFILGHIYTFVISPVHDYIVQPANLNYLSVTWLALS
ncbi:MAG: hypothetical protein IKV93_02030 [Alphaproteobacteria bacterium]|nr:hypothetical protein [Alphaproteobacteria bacterium]